LFFCKYFYQERLTGIKLVYICRSNVIGIHINFEEIVAHFSSASDMSESVSVTGKIVEGNKNKLQRILGLTPQS